MSSAPNICPIFNLVAEAISHGTKMAAPAVAASRHTPLYSDISCVLGWHYVDVQSLLVACNNPITNRMIDITGGGFIGLISSDNPSLVRQSAPLIYFIHLEEDIILVEPALLRHQEVKNKLQGCLWSVCRLHHKQIAGTPFTNIV